MAVQLATAVRSLTRGMSFQLPQLRAVFAFLLAWSFLAGFALHAAFLRLPEAFLFGGAAGLIIFALPAVSAAVIAAGALSRKSFWSQIKYFLFTAVVSTLVVTVIYAIATLAFGFSSPKTYVLVELANAIVYVIWFVSLFVALGNDKVRAALIAAIHPIASLALLVLWNKWAIVETRIALPFVLTLPKLALASAIILAAFWFVFYLFNAPTKRNLGFSGAQAVSLFFAHWLRGSREIEQILDEAGADAQTTLGTVAFKDASGRLKALFLAPNVHFGPYGDLGGSEFPRFLTERFDARYGCTTLVFHGTVYHDFNPVSSSSFASLSTAFDRALRSCKHFESTGEIIEARRGAADVAGLRVGGNVFLTLSPAPYPTGDIDYSAGVALSNAAERVFDCVVVADRHNSAGEIEPWGVGSREYSEFENAVRALQPGRAGKLSVGVAKASLPFSVREGVGGAGLRVVVLRAGNKSACFAVFDANNILPELRAKLKTRLKGYDFADICTTDTHSVNSPTTPSNALGQRADWGVLEKALVDAVAEAEASVEPCSVAVAKTSYKTRVLGSSQANELITTLKSIFAILRVLAPAVIAAAILLAAAALLLV